jgi:hypothetical protein
MTARIVVTKATPLPSIAAGRATERDQKDWEPRLRVIRACMHCKTVYFDAGRAGLGEHWCPAAFRVSTSG